MDGKVEILFVQNCPERGFTAIEAFRPDPAASQMYVVRELEAVGYLLHAGFYAHCPDPGLIVLDVGIAPRVERTIRRELKRTDRTFIPVVSLQLTRGKTNGLS